MIDAVWDELFQRQEWGRYPAEPLVRFVAQNFYSVPVREHVKFLEIGCGPGSNIWYLAREGFSFVGVDGSKTAIKIASDRLDAECPGWRSRGQLLLRDMMSLDLPEQSFDAVIDSECVYTSSFEDAQTVYSSLGTLTKRNGLLFIRTFARGSWGDESGTQIHENYWLCDTGPLEGKGPSRFSSQGEMSKLVGNYWKILSSEITSTTFNNGQAEVKELLVIAQKI